jgi:hypothetical protein
MAQLSERYDVFVTPCAGTPAFKANRTHPKTIDGVLANYMGGSMRYAAMTMASCAAGGLRPFRSANRIAVAEPQERTCALAMAGFLERLLGLDRLLPISRGNRSNQLIGLPSCRETVIWRG